jgi:hypothetical protein
MTGVNQTQETRAKPIEAEAEFQHKWRKEINPEKRNSNKQLEVQCIYLITSTILTLNSIHAIYAII